MTKLGHHPDRGGDHETAVLINHAYAVLSDPVKRAEYDRLLPQRHRKRTEGDGSATASEFNRSHLSNTEAQCSNDDRCTFCDERVVAVVQAGIRCPRCVSPLARVKRPKWESNGRRAMSRMPRSEQIVVYPSWPHPGCEAQLQDLSPTGIRFLTEHDLRIQQVLKISGATFDGVARIVSRTLLPQSTAAALFSVRAKFLTIEFAASTGVFVSARI